jgi:hypothetical protein
MSFKLLALPAIGALAIMFGLNAASLNETLQTEDGVSAAGILPLDKAASRTAFQTATFGLG